MLMKKDKQLKLTKEDFEKLMKYVETHGKDEKFDAIQQIIAKRGNVAQIYKFAKIEGADIEVLSQAMAEEACQQLRYINHKLIKSNHRFSRYNSNDLYSTVGNIYRLIYRFAKDIEGADIEVLSQAVAKTKVPDFIFEVAKIEGADIEVLSQAMAETKHARLIEEFAKDIQGADIAVLTEGMAKTKNPELILSFAREIKGADIAVLTKAMAKTKNPVLILSFAREIKGADMAVLTNST